jgi:hypothetical protein
MNQYKAPRDKMVCILNCCRVVSNALSTAAAPGGADDLLPVLIYVTIKAQVPQLHSNLQYVLRFRMEHRLRSEAAYYFTNLVSAAYFLRTVWPRKAPRHAPPPPCGRFGSLRRRGELWLGCHRWRRIS